MDLVVQFLLLVLGFVMLVKGADWFVEGVAGIAEKFGIPQLVIGLTIVAMGTSAPEAAVSIASAVKGNAGITVGNVVGSNIMNILVILGITAVITTIAVQKSTVRYEMPFMLLTMIVMLLFGMSGNVITFAEGLMMWGLFILYMIYLLMMAKKNKEDTKPEKSEPVWLLIILGIVGAVLVVWGADVAVDSASAIARFFGMSERFVGLTIVAFGTSLPELVTSIMAAHKKKADIAIGNIVGSNIFNVLFVCGTTAIVTPVMFQNNFIIDSLVAVGAGIILWLGVLKNHKLSRPVGITMLLCYAGYFVYLLV
ncbi:MAG: calcium/sodium antiporter [Lachnospiraceae bacterium]|nr:calcium/sodium antiporter [Lachnospiraceae bacterium]